MEFSYLAEKIAAAPIVEEPFRHVYVRDLLSEEHFERIVTDPQIHFRRALSTTGLLTHCARMGYRPQAFPGCTTNVVDYLRRHRTGRWPEQDAPVEGFGLALRLKQPRSPWLGSLLDYLNGREFLSAIETKFELDSQSRVETAIQKYLSGYEISPHPDIRRKSATYMLNINDPRHDYPETLHTHLMRFTDENRWIYERWTSETDVDRCWVPWDWCETVTETVDNNAMVMFAPSNDTLHAVKLRYDHRRFQRTQIYGNLWSTDEERLSGITPSTYRDLVSS